MGTIIIKDAVKREPGYIYFINGSGDICSAKMSRGRKAKKKTAKAKAIKTVKKTVKAKTKSKKSKK